MQRRINTQTLGWFWDLFKRERLELDPPYQRRSVWNQSYKDFFVDTVLLDYPSPAIFLYEEIDSGGFTKYSVVDGKQRLSTIFEFIEGGFPVYDEATISEIRGLYFSDLPQDRKQLFFAYVFAVEYLPSSEEDKIDNIFDRINRNVAKLSAQELRHAKFDGEFITVCEDLTERMISDLPPNFPSIATRSRSQMKDVELVAQLLLLIESGPKSVSQASLDDAFAERDDEWELKTDVKSAFEETTRLIKTILNSDGSQTLVRSRLRNQADFYSFFGAVYEMREDLANKDASQTADKLVNFIRVVDDEASRAQFQDASSYYTAARSASNDATPRQTRIRIMKKVLSGADID